MIPGSPSGVVQNPGKVIDDPRHRSMTRRWFRFQPETADRSALFRLACQSAQTGQPDAHHALAVATGCPAEFKPSRGGQGFRDRQPLTIRSLKLQVLDDSRVRLDIATGVRTSAFVHYLNGNTQLAMDIPNAVLRLSEPTDAEQSLTHPLLTALHATMAQDTPPMARITLDTTRVVGFTLSPQSKGISLEMRLPRSATGALAGKVIVVDAGHGGSSTGALGHGGGGITYEKNCTLAIALCLRADLGSCGAKVVMSRRLRHRRAALRPSASRQ